LVGSETNLINRVWVVERSLKNFEETNLKKIPFFKGVKIADFISGCNRVGTPDSGKQIKNK
jgi:hypothetical protein